MTKTKQQELEAEVARLRSELSEQKKLAEEAQVTVESVAVMLGWSNVPPRESLEANLRANRRRLEAAEAKVRELESASAPPKPHEEIRMGLIALGLRGAELDRETEALDRRLDDAAAKMFAAMKRVDDLGRAVAQLRDEAVEHAEAAERALQEEREECALEGEKAARYSLQWQAERARTQRYAAALKHIEKWEFPPTGITWDGGSPMSYSAAFGSHGERDFMRDVASAALDEAPKGPPELFIYEIRVQWSSDEGTYIATVPSLPGISADGASPDAACSEVVTGAQLALDVMRQHGDPIPSAAVKESRDRDGGTGAGERG